MPPYRPVAYRLFEKVDFQRAQTFFEGTRCHEWTGHVVKATGYGLISIHNRAELVHRVAWTILMAWQPDRGVIPDGLYILHRCDNRVCVNGLHLFCGTFDDNMADMVQKQRQAHGERNGHAKLTEEQVLFIRASGQADRALALQFGVTSGTIFDIRRRRSWRLI